MLFKLKNLIRKKGLEFFKSNLIIELNASVFDSKGKKINKFSKVSDSLTGNFLQYLYTNFSQGDSINYLLSSFNGGSNDNTKSTTGGMAISRDNIMKANTLANNSLFGIVYGLNNTPVTALDYKLIAPISSGTGVNQLIYNQMQSSQAPQNVGNTTSFKIYRLFTNNSGVEIIVNECGLYVQTGTSYVCIYRDVILGGLSIPNAGVSNLELTFNVTT